MRSIELWEVKNFNTKFRSENLEKTALFTTKLILSSKNSWKIVVSFPRILTIPGRWRHFQELQAFVSGNTDTIGSGTSSPIFGFSSRFSPCLQNSGCLFGFQCYVYFRFVYLYLVLFVYDKFWNSMNRNYHVMLRVCQIKGKRFAGFIFHPTLQI